MVPAPTDVALNPATILLNFIFIPQCADHTSLHFFIQLLSGVLLSPLSFSGSLGRDRIWLMLVSPFAVPHQSLVLRQLVRGWKLQPTFSFRRRLTIRNLEPADVISWSLLFLADVDGKRTCAAASPSWTKTKRSCSFHTS